MARKLERLSERIESHEVSTGAIRAELEQLVGDIQRGELAG